MSTETSFVLRCALAAVIVALVAAAAAWGQLDSPPAETTVPGATAAEANPSPAEPTPPFIGKMWAETAKRVFVRSGPGTAYYPVAVLAVGTEVTVVTDDGTWKQIDATTECFSLIAKEFVSVSAEDKTAGKVAGEDVNVRAFPYYSKRVKDPYARQASLSTGDKVTIVGEWTGTLDGEPFTFYKIAPPPGARAYVASQFCKFDRALDPAVVRTGQWAEDPALADLSPKQFANLEKALEAACRKPSIDKIDTEQLKDLATRYQTVAETTRGEQLKVQAAWRVKWITHRIALIETYRRAQQAAAAIDRRLAAPLSTAEIPRTVARDQSPEARFTAVGTLKKGLFTAQHPRRFRLVATEDGVDRTRCYVEAVPGGPLLASLLGKRVGVTGTRNWITTWRQHLIYVREVEVLELDAPATRPAETLTVEPTTRPADAP